MKYVFWIAVIVAVVFAAWQVLAPGVANFIFQDDLKDSSAQMGYRTGMARLNTDDEIRDTVIRKAAQHDIVLDPKQVTVERSGAGEYTTWYIAVDYTVKADLLVYSLPLHFKPTSKGGGFWPKVESPPPPAKPAPHKRESKRSEAEPHSALTADRPGSDQPEVSPLLTK